MSRIILLILPRRLPCPLRAPSDLVRVALAAAVLVLVAVAVPPKLHVFSRPRPVAVPLLGFV